MKTVLVLLLLCPITGWAQFMKITPQDTERGQSFLLMRDGSIVKGQIMRQDSSVITVRKHNGDMTFVEADQLVSITASRPGQAVNTNTGSLPALYPIFVLKDGSQVEGWFVRRDSTMITVRKRNGQLTYFEPELLVRVDSVQTEVVNGIRPVTPNRFSPWLLSGQTAYTAEAGTLYYRNIFLLFNEFDYGISRNWSVGASVNPLYEIFDNGTGNPREVILDAIARFSTKVSFPIGDQFRFGVNATYRPAQRGTFVRLEGLLTLQGLASFGDSQRNVTLGYGQNRYGGSYPSHYPFISVGVMHKLSPRLTFLSDNTFYISGGGQQSNLSAAFRFDRRRHAFDLGALAVVYPYYYGGSRALFSPYIGYNLLIGGK